MLLSIAKMPKRPRDTDQLAKSIIDIATGEAEDDKLDDGKVPAGVALGRKGGLKGGRGAQKNSPTCGVRKSPVRRRRNGGVELNR